MSIFHASTTSEPSPDVATSVVALVCLAVLSWCDLLALTSPTIGLVAGTLMTGAAVVVRPTGPARSIRVMLVVAGVVALALAVTTLVTQAA